MGVEKKFEVKMVFWGEKMSFLSEISLIEIRKKTRNSKGKEWQNSKLGTRCSRASSVEW